MSGGGSKLRCAVYTRKSTEEGLEQEFNSLDAQREACLAFVASQVGLGWRPIADCYNDGGISGGTMERPALQRLLQDIRDRKIDVVVVYKIDRLTRSLMDFSKIVEIFDANGVSFVSVTQQFNTTTSMGRLTLNVLLSFAQFEREVTAERIRDKIAASRKKGIWMGGTVPMGYRAIDKKLVVDEEAAIKVRAIFARYLEVQSVIALTDELNAEVEADRELILADQPARPRKPYSRGKLYHMLANPVYLGKARHREHLYEGDHQAIVDKDVFNRAQELLKGQAPRRRSASSIADLHLLTGIVYDETGDRLSTAFTSNHGRRYRYYISNRLKIADKKDLTGWRVPADQLEGAVVHQVRAVLGDRVRLSQLLSACGRDVAEGMKAASSFLKNGFDRLSHGDKRSFIRSLFPRIVVAPGSMQLDVDLCGLIHWLDASGNKAALNVSSSTSIETIKVPLLIKRRGNEARIVIEGRNPTRTDPHLVELIGRAHNYLALLTDGSGRSLADLAKAVGVHIADVSRVLPLAFLAPALVDAILTGRHPVELTARQLSRLGNFPVDWQQQRALLGF